MGCVTRGSERVFIPYLSLLTWVEWEWIPIQLVRAEPRSNRKEIYWPNFISEGRKLDLKDVFRFWGHTVTKMELLRLHVPQRLLLIWVVRSQIGHHAEIVIMWWLFGPFAYTRGSVGRMILLGRISSSRRGTCPSASAGHKFSRLWGVSFISIIIY